MRAQLKRSALENLIFFGLVGRQVLPVAGMEMALPILWFAAIQSIKRNQDLADLARKVYFVAVEAVERVVGQIGETQKATRELSIGMDGMLAGFSHEAGHDFRFVGNAVRRRIVVQTARVSPPKRRIDDLSMGPDEVGGPA